MRIKSSKDFATGLLFLAIGLGAYYIGSTYNMGTAQRPGTGVLPRILAWCLMGSGLLLTVQALFQEGPKLDAWAWRPLIMVTVATIAFALLIDSAGLVVDVRHVSNICGREIGLVGQRQRRRLAHDEVGFDGRVLENLEQSTAVHDS